MHDQSASRISGRTRAALSAMCVPALRIRVLKSAGNFTRGECHDLSAEKIRRVKCFMFTRYEIVARKQFSNADAAGWVRKFLAVVNWRKWRFTSPCPVYPPEADTKRKGRHVRWVPIVLQKSFCGMGLKFSEAWARRLNNDVGDHVATRQTHRRFWQRVCGSIERRLSLVSFFGENLAAAAFGTFATLSANDRHPGGLGWSDFA
jgi:hypothetical protein